MQMSIAIIPARGGSKRIPRKNIKEFCGKPMLAYAVNAAKASGLFDHVVVSTEDKEIAEIANKYEAETPFLRPFELANDYTVTAEVIEHAIRACQQLGWEFDKVCCIYPSVPFIQINDLIGAARLLNDGGAGFSFPITEFPSPIQRALRLLNKSKIQPFDSEFQLTRTQDLEPAFYDAGQFYWGSVDAWLSNFKIHSNGLGYRIPNWRVVDIDTPDDWMRAELIFQSIINNKLIFINGAINEL